MGTASALISATNLKKYYPVNKGFFGSDAGYVKAVDGVDLQVFRGETLGLVGESGCGKTTLGKIILSIEKPTEGEVFLEGENITLCSSRQLRPLRKEMQVIFQDPYSSLDPRQPIGRSIEEPMVIHGIGDKKSQRERALKLMEIVGLRPEQFARYPHEFSGGQRQRIGIARALALNPKLVICDEPVSALDVSIQSQVLNLLQDLQEEFGLTYLFITHDLSVVAHISNRVAVMYLGRIVELASSISLYRAPRHPYTEALLSASPIPDPTVARKRLILKGDVPNPISPPAGCHFHTRCPYAQEKCKCEPPPGWTRVAPDHSVRCWRYPEKN
jgi:oligopeptide transport system ATP-binding protein